MFLEFYMIMVILNMVIFLRISKYGNIAYGNVFRNYYHIWTPKYGKIKNLWPKAKLNTKNSTERRRKASFG